MIKISEEKWAKLPQIDDRLTEKYGPVGSPQRKEFQAKAEAWYFSELLRDERKRQKLTQQELGERIGKKVNIYLLWNEVRPTCNSQLSCL